MNDGELCLRKDNQNDGKKNILKDITNKALFVSVLYIEEERTPPKYISPHYFVKNIFCIVNCIATLKLL